MLAPDFLILDEKGLALRLTILGTLSYLILILIFGVGLLVTF